jgi:hypothetical protein
MKIKYTGKQAQETKPIAAKKKPIKDLKDWGV